MTRETADIKAIAERIRAIRERRGMTIEEVATYLRMGRVNYNRKELGGVIVSAPEIAELSRLMEVRASYFYGEDSDEDLSRHEIVKFFEGLPPAIQDAELEHMRMLHAAHVESSKSPTVGRKAE